MATARYFDLVREMKDAYNHRLRLVQSARQIGIKPTARLFSATVPRSANGSAVFSNRDPPACANIPALRTISRGARHQS